MTTLSVRTCLIIMVALLWAGACTNNNDQERADPAEVGQVVARIGGVPVFKEELDREIKSLLGDKSAQLGEKGRHKLLDSLLRRKAMALAAEKELDEGARRELDEGVLRFRNRELIKMFLRNHSQPRPITSEMVEQYYLAHQAEFGSAQIKHYRMLIASNLRHVEQKKMIRELFLGVKNDMWDSVLKQAKSQGVKARIQVGKVGGGLLHQGLRTAMKDLAPGQTSRPIAIGDHLYLVQVTHEESGAARPLPEVRLQIRKTLAVQTLKQNVEQASEFALKKLAIEFVKEEKLL